MRPGTPNKAASGFFSNILREPLTGHEAVLPVSEDVRHWHATPRAAVGFFHRQRPWTSSLLGWRRNLAAGLVGHRRGTDRGADGVAEESRRADPARARPEDRRSSPAGHAISTRAGPSRSGSWPKTRRANHPRPYRGRTRQIDRGRKLDRVSVSIRSMHRGPIESTLRRGSPALQERKIQPAENADPFWRIAVDCEYINRGDDADTSDGPALSG